MPKRMIRDWTDSERVNSLTPQAERFYLRLLMKADDFGRFHAATKLLRSFLFPLLIDVVREADISRWIAECETAGLIVIYEVDGKKLLEIWNFGQRLDKARAKFPPPPGDVRDSPGNSGKVPAEEEVEDEKNLEKEQKSCPDIAQPPSGPTPALLFPIAARNGGPVEWPLFADRIADFQDCYPGIDALAEAKKARQWCIANREKRKTSRGMAAFLNRWMARAQDDACTQRRTGDGRGTGPAGGGETRLDREIKREQHQLDILAEWAGGDDAVQPEGIRGGSGASHGHETHGRIVEDSNRGMAPGAGGV